MVTKDPFKNPVLTDAPGTKHEYVPDRNSNPATQGGIGGVGTKVAPKPGEVQTTIDTDKTTINPDTSIMNPVEPTGEVAPIKNQAFNIPGTTAPEPNAAKSAAKPATAEKK